MTNRNVSLDEDSLVDFDDIDTVEIIELLGCIISPLGRLAKSILLNGLTFILSPLAHNSLKHSIDGLR